MCPVFITQGVSDVTVPQDNSQGMYAALQSAGVDVVYRAYPGNHEYGLLTQAQTDTIYREIQAFIQGQFPVI